MDTRSPLPPTPPAVRFNREMALSYGRPDEMAPGILRLVAPNPGPFTFKGTNTYLIGTTTLAVVDPGPDNPAHCASILMAAAGRPITAILLTHTHRDHVDGLARLKAASGATTYAFPRPHAPAASRAASSAGSPSGRDFIDSAFRPGVALAHGDTFSAGGETVTALHTPGHAPDHLCFALSDRGILLSGDHVMGWNTSVIAPPEGNMADYIAALEALLERPESLYLPGHGERIVEASRTVRAYLLHRRWREQSILDAIRAGHRTIRTIVPAVYPGLDAPLVPAAALSVLAHVEHLHRRGLLAGDLPLGPDCDLSAV